VRAEPLGRRILDQPIVLYRKTDGTVAALEDRCAHRYAPLSIGKVEGDDIVCGYHGFRYGPDGKCNHVPTQDAIPPRAKVRAYPVREIGPFIWIWTGDEEAMLNVPLPPDISWSSDPAWLINRGGYYLHANYMAMKENVLDLTHFAFVHSKTFEIMDFLHPPTVSAEGNRVTYRKELADMPLPPLYGEPTGIGSEKNATRVFSGSFVSPAIQEATVEILDPTPAPGRRAKFLVFVMHLTTPETHNRTHYWWIRGQNFGQGPGVKEQLQTTVEAAFAEDKVVLEATQDLIDKDRGINEAPKVSVRADEAGVRIRRVVEQLILKESPEGRPHV